MSDYHIEIMSKRQWGNTSVDPKKDWEANIYAHHRLWETDLTYSCRESHSHFESFCPFDEAMIARCENKTLRLATKGMSEQCIKRYMEFEYIIQSYYEDNIQRSQLDSDSPVQDVFNAAFDQYWFVQLCYNNPLMAESISL